MKLSLLAFTETANLVVLTIVGVAVILTRDLLLLALALSIEVAYLYFAGRAERFKVRIQSRPSVEPLDRVLLLVSVAGFVVILFFGFGKHLLTHPFPFLTHSAGWEAGALIWTGLFLLYYVAKFRSTGKRGVDVLIIILFSVVSWWLIQLAWQSMGTPITHVFFVWLIGLCFFVIDLLVSKKHPEPKERKLSHASLLWADAPMVIAFLVLFAYLLFHRDTEHPDVFVSGVVSCQLLVSNAVFIVMEFGLLQLPQPMSNEEVQAPAPDQHSVPGIQQIQ